MKIVQIASATGMNGAIRQNPDYEVELRKYIIDSGLSDRVRVLGNRSDLPDLMAASDCSCLPSNREVMPISCIEAMAAGVPVVITDTGGIGQLLKNGSDALIVPRNNLDALTAALVAVAENAQLRQQLVESARGTFARVFSRMPASIELSNATGALVSKNSGLPPRPLERRVAT